MASDLLGENAFETTGAAASDGIARRKSDREIVLCDLAPGLTERLFRQVLGQYGNILSFTERVISGIRAASREERIAIVEYEDSEAAEEATKMLNLSAVKGRTCRCFLTSAVKTIRQTMGTGQRLFVEDLDPAINSAGLYDVCQLFGAVLDCKVESDEDEQSRGYGFVHYADPGGAEKALTFMSGAQVGSCAIELRLWEPADAVLLTGCLYDVASASDDAAGETDPVADSAGEFSLAMVESHFRSLEYHHVETIDGKEAKLERLKALIGLYSPNHERQMLVVADASSLQAVTALVAGLCEASDHAVVEPGTSAQLRKAAIEGYDTGNLYILVLASEASAHRNTDLAKAPAVLVNFDFPRTLPLHLHRIYKRTDRNTRIHSFFSPLADPKLALQLLSLLEEVGHEVPADLFEALDRSEEPAAGEEQSF